MKSVVIIFILFCSHAYGQRHHTDIAATLKKGDSLETLYANEHFFKIITDTLPLYTTDENSGWRDMKLVSYFYDNSKALKKISFRNGREGYYYFYFDGVYLRKVRVLKHADLINLQYYFTDQDNRYNSSEIEQMITQYSATKELYELLKMGKSFLDKFKTL